MVAVAAIFTTYLLTPTRRSRRQIWYETTHPLLRIRNCTIAVHFVYVYVLLIRPTYTKATIYLLIYVYVYRSYTFTVSAATIAPITATTAINLIHRPILFIHCCPPIPTLLPPIRLHLLYSIYIYDLRCKTEGTLFRLSCLFYIRIYILIRTTYTSCCGSPR